MPVPFLAVFAPDPRPFTHLSQDLRPATRQIDCVAQRRLGCSQAAITQILADLIFLDSDC